MTAWVLPLVEALEPAQVGGKACSLARMLACEVPVPEGVVLTNAAFQAFLAQDGLGARIAELAAGLDARDVAGVQATAARIRELVLAAELPPPVRSALHEACTRLPPGEPLIVRSSAVGEDSAHASFAGQLDSLLDVQGPEQLERAVRACWASYWSARVLSYQLGRKVALAGMGVVLQRQVRARLSGVLFTRAPGSGEDALVGEYCYGLGEALVSGRVTPGRFTLLRPDGRWQHLASPEPASEEDDAVLFHPAQMSALGVHALRLEERLGGPQDIEWTVDTEGRLFLVQSRPITAPVSAPVSAPRAARQVLWSNANVNENFPGPVTPLLFSIAAEGYTHYFRNLARAFGLSAARLTAMEPYLRHLVGAHGARLYYNLSNIHAVLRLAPFGEALAAAFDRFVGAPQEEPEEASRSVAASHALELVRCFAAVTWRYASIERRIRDFERTADAFAERTHPRALSGQPLVALREHLRAFLDIRFHRWTHASLADAAAMVCHGALEQLLRRALPDPSQGALHNTLLKGLKDLASSAPVEALWELSRLVRADAALREHFATRGGAELVAAVRSGNFPAFEEALEAYLERHGFRGSGELMLTVPSFQEDCTGLLELLKGYVGLDGPSPSELLARQGAEREASTARLHQELAARALLPGVHSGHLLTLALRWTQAAIAYRERARTKQALLYSRLRRLALAIGEGLAARGTLAAVEDVFFLTYPELDGLLSGGVLLPDVRELVRVRRAQHEALSRLQPPDRLVLAEGETYRGEADAAGVPEAAEGALTGAGTCGGRVTAPAAVLADLSEAGRLSAGDVLVTRQTDPGWAPVFFLIKGLVLERGGMLSHGSILAREFGLPSVVGVRGATTRIRHGQTVCVDGDLGHVVPLD